MGRSGSGKTTLLTVVAGWEPPDAGKVTVFGDGVAVGAVPWGEVAIVPQSLGLLDELTVAENVRPAVPAERVPDAADPMPRRSWTGSGSTTWPTGSPTRCRSASSSGRPWPGRPSSGPGCSLADEPIAHQNQGWALAMMDLLREAAADGTACLLATHNEVAVSSADRVLELHEGRLRPV